MFARRAALTLLLSSLALTAEALAVPDRVNGVKGALDTPCLPGCGLCHEDPRGGLGTATRPFAEGLLARGFDYTQASSLVATLELLDRERADADGDGDADVDELRAGLDPNDPAADAVLCAEARGSPRAPRAADCSAARGRRSTPWLLVVTIAGVCVARRRRAAQPPSPVEPPS